MNCAESVAELGAYLDGQVPRGVSDGLELHLAGCPACRERFAREAQLEGVIAGALRASPEPAVDDAIWRRALDLTLVAAPEPASGTSWWARFSRAPARSKLRWFALVASLALLATFSMAGLGLRRSLHATAPPASDRQDAGPGPSR